MRWNVRVPRGLFGRRLVAGASAAVIVLTSITGSVNAAPGTGGPDRVWIVTIEPGGDLAPRVRALAKQVGHAPEHIYSHALTGFSFRGLARSAAKLAGLPGVV